VVGTAGNATLVQPKTKRNVILGLIAGLALGIALAFIREALDTRVRSADELRARLGMPLLGQVPMTSRRLAQSQALATLSEPTSSSTEAFRILKNRVEISKLERDVRSIVVTSPREDEDNSATAANLAVTLAQSGRHVILLDLNLRNPSIDRLFGLRDLGFTGAAVAELVGVELTDALTPVDVNTRRLNTRSGTLEVLCAGELPPDPGEFLQSRFVAEALAGLEKCCDLLLINTPSVLAVGDAMTVAKHADAVILVAQVNRVRRETLIETRELLDGCAAVKLGVIATVGRSPKRISFMPAVRGALTAAGTTLAAARTGLASARTALAAARSRAARWRPLAAPSARHASKAARKLQIFVALSASVVSERVRRSTKIRRASPGSAVPEQARTPGRAERREQVPHV
jgi:capsular exopolysaccharide synthesis family protein